MITRRQLDDLIGNYERASRLVGEAGNILIDSQSTAVEVTGQFGPTSSTALISATADLFSELFQARQIMLQVTPPD